MIWNFPRFFRVFSPAGGIFRNSEPVWCPHSFLCLLFPGKGKRTAFSFCFSKKKTPGKRKKRPGKPFEWFPRTPSIDQSLALDLRRMEVGESTIDFVGADAERICNAPSSRTAALGIGPYKHERGAAKNRRGGRTGSSAPTKVCVIGRRGGNVSSRGIRRRCRGGRGSCRRAGTR